MRVPELVEAIKSQYRANGRRIPIFAQGQPGIGKSDAPLQAARELTEELDDNEQLGPVAYMQLQATIEDPITLSGLPARDLDGEHAVFLHFRDKLPTRGRGILEIAEINTAPPMVQAGFYRLFLEGRLGSYILPDGWYQLATGNRDDDRAATQRIPMPLIGRWARVKVECDLQAWTRWALQHGIRTELVAFYQFRPDLFNTFDATKPEPYSCPRTAVFASNLMDSAPPALEHEMIAGVLGDGVATELMAFVQIYRNMVSPDAILLNPDTAPVPEQPSTLYAVCGALAAKATTNNFRAVVTYCNRMAAEYAVLLVQLAVRRDNKITSTRAFIDWASDRGLDMLS